MSDRLWRRFARDPLALGGLAFLLLVIVVAIAAPLVAPYPPDAQNLNAINGLPSTAHWFGTDDLGRDILSRIIWGARSSLQASFQIVGMAIVVALPIGLAAGHFRGWFDNAVMRLMDAIFSFPPLVLALAVAALLGASLTNASLAIAVVFVPSFVRLIRGEVMAVREELYIESSQSLGISAPRLVRSHVLPNVASPIVIQVALSLGFALLAEAGLAFLGVAEQPPSPSWGVMLSEAYQFIYSDPWALVFPGLAIALTVLSFNLVADGLRSALGGGEGAGRRAGAMRPRWSRLGWGTGTVEGPPLAPPEEMQPPVALHTVTQGPVEPEPGPATPGLVRVEDLRIEFSADGRWLPAVDGLSFGIEPGTTLGLVGESGSGKTLSSLAVMQLLPAGARQSSGSVTFEGRELSSMTRRELRDLRGDAMSMVFQEPMTSLNPALSIGSQIAEQIRAHRGLGRSAAWKVAVEMLERVEIPRAATRAREYPHSFSGGMRQRVMIAMAISCRPKLLIADEPTTALDVTTQAQILDLLRSLVDEERMAMLFVTHDLGVIAEIADQVVVLYAGQKVEQAHAAELFLRPRHPYSAALLASMPQAAPLGAPLPTIAGSVPRPDQYGSSCRFEARCPFAVEACRTTEVPLRAVSRRPADRPPDPDATGHRARCLRQDELDLSAHSPSTAPGAEPGRPARVGLGDRPPPPDVVPPPVLAIDRLVKRFPVRTGLLRRVTASVDAVDDVSLEIPAGTTLGLVGESGSGKSTLARLVVRVIDPTSGSIRLEGTDIGVLHGSELRRSRRLMQMVFQDPYSSLDPRHTVGDAIAEPLVAHTRLTAAERDRRVRELLEQVGMESGATSRYPRQFSGGQRQRIAIARALAVHPRLLVCDEPVSALDVSTQAQVLNLLSELQDQYGLAYLFITHDLSVVGHISDRIAVMYLGRIVEEGPTEEILVRPTHPYTAALLSAIPVPDVVEARARPRIVLRGEAEQPTGETSRCAFAPCCAFAMDVCRLEVPMPFEAPSGVTVRCHLHDHGPALSGTTVRDLTTSAATGAPAETSTTVTTTARSGP